MDAERLKLTAYGQDMTEFSYSRTLWSTKCKMVPSGAELACTRSLSPSKCVPEPSTAREHRWHGKWLKLFYRRTKGLWSSETPQGMRFNKSADAVRGRIVLAHQSDASVTCARFNQIER